MKLFSSIIFLFFLFPLLSFAQDLPGNQTFLYDTVHTVKNTYDTVMVVDTVYEYEYEEPDTLRSDTVIKPILTPVVEKIIRPTITFLEMSAGVLPELFNLPLSVQQSFGYTHNITSRLYYSTGLGVVIKNQIASFDEKVFTSNEYSKGFIKTDTIDMYYKINSASDTFWFPITRQKWIDKVDSSIITKTDTTHIRHSVQKRNTFAFIEIPVSLRFIIYKSEKVSLALSGGLNIGVMFYRKQYLISDDQKDYIVTTKLPGFAPSLRLISSLDVLIPLSDHCTISLSPGYSYYAIAPVEPFTKHHVFINAGLLYRL